MTAFVELYIDQGTDFNHIINLTDELTNQYINVTGYMVTAQMRHSYESENASANIVCTISNPTQGEISLSLHHDVTSNLKADRYVFDVLAFDSNNLAERLLEGYITVTPSVTRT